MKYFVSFLIGFIVVGFIFVTYCLFRMASIDDRQMEQLSANRRSENSLTGKAKNSSGQIVEKMQTEVAEELNPGDIQNNVDKKADV